MNKLRIKSKELQDHPILIMEFWRDLPNWRSPRPNLPYVVFAHSDISGTRDICNGRNSWYLNKPIPNFKVNRITNVRQPACDIPELIENYEQTKN